MCASSARSCARVVGEAGPEAVVDGPLPLPAVHPPQAVAPGRGAGQVPQEEPEDLRRVEQVLSAARKAPYVLVR